MKDKANVSAGQSDREHVLTDSASCRVQALGEFKRPTLTGEGGLRSSGHGLRWVPHRHTTQADNVQLTVTTHACKVESCVGSYGRKGHWGNMKDIQIKYGF